MADIAVVPIEQVEISFAPWEWPFARERRSEIDRHFDQCQRERPGIWNGRVLLLNQHSVADGMFRGTCFETDYASFLAWRDWRFPDHTVKNFFAAGVVRSSDDAYLLGEMATHTAAAGSIYFPVARPSRTISSPARPICLEMSRASSRKKPGSISAILTQGADGSWLPLVVTLRC